MIALYMLNLVWYRLILIGLGKMLGIVKKSTDKYKRVEGSSIEKG